MTIHINSSALETVPKKPKKKGWVRALRDENQALREALRLVLGRMATIPAGRWAKYSADHSDEAVTYRKAIGEVQSRLEDARADALDILTQEDVAWH